MDFFKLNVIDTIKKEGLNFEFVDGLKTKNVPDMIQKNVKNISVSPFTDDSCIYVFATSFSLPTDDKNRVIRVNVPPEDMKLITSKILSEKWDMFTATDNEKRNGYSFSARGECFDDKIMYYTFNISYRVQPFETWEIVVEKGYKRVETVNGIKKTVKNSYYRMCRRDICLSTKNISLWACKIKSAIENMENYSFPKYYESRLEAEQHFKK